MPSGQSLIRDGTLPANYHVRARPASKLSDYFAQNAFGAHFGADRRGRHVRLFDLEARQSTRHEIRISDLCWALDPNIEPAVWRVLIPPSSYGGKGITFCCKLCGSQSSNEVPEISVTQTTDVVAKNFEHKP